MSSLLKYVLAAGAAVILPLGLESQTDHLSGARRSQWRWAGAPVTDWEIEANAHSRWVEEVLGLAPDYFTQGTGPMVISTVIGALPAHAREVAVFHALWEAAAPEEKDSVRIQALLCVLERDWNTRDQMVEEAQKRWHRL